VKRLLNRKPWGVHVVGNFEAEKGLGKAARSTLLALESQGLELSVENVRADGNENPVPFELEKRASFLYPLTINHVNVHEIQAYVSRTKKSVLRRRYNIGFWYWELADFPPEWQRGFDTFYEVWTGSCFAQEALARVAPVPVLRMPPVVEVLPLAVTDSQSFTKFGLNREDFLFLFAFDFQSSMERKNPLAVIRAFRLAFSPEERVTLVLKSTHGETSPQNLAELKKEALNLKVRLIDRVMSEADVHELFSLCHCYVSLHRAEGFGLTLAETMALGKPVIGTAYSGNLDFMNDSNSYLVPARLVEIDSDHGFYHKGMVWAEPDEEAAAQAMRYVFEHPEEALLKGSAARAQMDQNFGRDVVGKKYRERLENILFEL
jgi:glycosyltransferase involved in cell wall biosynthesis